MSVKLIGASQIYSYLFRMQNFASKFKPHIEGEPNPETLECEIDEAITLVVDLLEPYPWLTLFVVVTSRLSRRPKRSITLQLGNVKRSRRGYLMQKTN